MPAVPKTDGNLPLAQLREVGPSSAGYGKPSGLGLGHRIHRKPEGRDAPENRVTRLLDASQGELLISGHADRDKQCRNQRSVQNV